MLPFIIKRVGWMLLTLWVVFTVSFFLMRAAPGGPYSRERQLDPQVEANLKARYNLDAPLYKQYLTSLWNMCRGDLGCSFTRSDFTVNDIIRQGMPISATLGFLAMSFAVFLGITAGIVSATHRNSPSDFILMSLATIGIALPDFYHSAFPGRQLGNADSSGFTGILLGRAVRGVHRPTDPNWHAGRLVTGLHSHRKIQRA